MTDTKTMNRRAALSLLAAGTLALTGCQSSSPRRPLAATDTILCLGDSLTAGFGAPAEAAYPAVLAQQVGRRVQNAGLNGETAAGAADRLPALLAERRHAMVLAGVGGNDFLRGVPLRETRHALGRIAAHATAAGARVVLIAEPAADLFAAMTGSLFDHPVYAEVAEQHGVELFAGAWASVLSTPSLRSDPIHANARGYAVFAERLAEWLRERGHV